MSQLFSEKCTHFTSKIAGPSSSPEYLRTLNSLDNALYLISFIKNLVMVSEICWKLGTKLYRMYFSSEFARKSDHLRKIFPGFN